MAVNTDHLNTQGDAGPEAAAGRDRDRMATLCQAAIAGSVAEARFGVPEWIEAGARARLPEDLTEVLDAFRTRVEGASRDTGLP